MKIALQCVLLFFFSSIPALVYAGPPYDTDDPEPVDYQHWEFYCSSIGSKANGTWMGTAPHVEINYGVAPNVQLHVTAPLSFYAPMNGKTNYGYGATELGTKFRFVDKDSSRFQIGIFPLIELPTGNSTENLGNGKPQIYLPIWIQKTISKWTAYGGTGYWINPGVGNKNYEFVGCQAQYQFIKSANIGGEICYLTPSQIGGSSDFRFRLGSIVDITDHHHLLFSIGRSVIGPTNLQWYVGYQFTI